MGASECGHLASMCFWHMPLQRQCSPPHPRCKLFVSPVFLHPVSFLKVTPGNQEVTCSQEGQGRLDGPAKEDLEIWKLGGICSSCAQQPYLTALGNLMNRRRIDR